MIRARALNWNRLIAAVLISGVSPLAAQRPDSTAWRVAFAIGPAYRELRDYVEPARRWGLGGLVMFEQSAAGRNTLIVYATGAEFSSANTKVNLISALSARQSAGASGRSAFSRAAQPWTPDGETTALQVTAAAIDLRRYLLADDNVGPFVGGGAGITFLKSSDHQTIRPAISVSAGHVWRSSSGARFFVECRYTWSAIDRDYFLLAKSPRWIIAPSFGLSTPL